jgi:hypothetical protein
MNTHVLEEKKMYIDMLMESNELLDVSKKDVTNIRQL